MVRVDNAATLPKSPPAKAAGVATMVMVIGATTHGRSAAFFYQIRIDMFACFPLPNVLMDQPHRF